jgi:hypothetical protein
MTKELRKPRFGGHTVEKEYWKNGLYFYRLIVRQPGDIVDDVCDSSRGLRRCVPSSDFPDRCVVHIGGKFQPEAKDHCATCTCNKPTEVQLMAAAMEADGQRRLL